MPSNSPSRAGRVTRADVEFFETNGFVRIKQLLSAKEVATLRAAVDAAGALRTNNDTRPLRTRTKRERIFTQCLNLWEEFPAIKAFTYKKRLARAAATLLRAKHVRLWHDHALYKEPGGTRTPWHVDQAYWPLAESTNVTCWIALDDVPLNAGGMAFIPGSHNLKFEKWIELDAPEDLLKFAPNAKKRTPVRYALRAGDATFHNGLTFHSAAPNKTKKPRKGFAIIYLADGTTFNGKNEHGIAMRSNFTIGKPVDGPLTPILW
jgi:phytanoyl-CoA hydroxylase